jgi:hypothetical protein
MAACAVYFQVSTSIVDGIAQYRKVKMVGFEVCTVELASKSSKSSVAEKFNTGFAGCAGHSRHMIG